jgi:GT2 family glycosyltransferase
VADPADRWPRVSVVVVNMDGLRHLGPCFDSLEALDYPKDRLELVLVDNGSRDKSVKFIRRHFPSVRVICNQENQGFAGANNQGVAAATGDYVAFLNNDMRADPDWLKELVLAIETARDVAVVGGKILNWEGSDVDFGMGSLNFYGMGFQPQDGSSADGHIEQVLFACGGSMLVDRSIFLDAGGFDPDYFAYFEDVDLGWRMWLYGYRVLYAPRSITYHRGHGTASKIAMSRLGVLYERNALYSIIKNYDEGNLNRVLPAALLLTVRRAMIFGRFNKGSYRMPRGASSGPIPLQPPRTEWLSPLLPDKEGSLLSRWLTQARDYGVREAVRGTFRVASMALFRLLQPMLGGEMLLATRHALSHLVAMDDLTDSMPMLMEKRAAIQARRKRRDDEILPLFRTPFAPHPPLEEYIVVQQTLVRIYGIDQIFADQ